MAIRRSRAPVWVLVSAAWTGPAILAMFETYAQARLAGRVLSVPGLIWQGADWLLYGLLTPIVFWFAGRYRLSRPGLPIKVAVHLAASLGLCAAWATGGLLLGWLIAPTLAPPAQMGWTAWFFTSLPFGVAVYFAVAGVEGAAFYFLQVQERETRAARLAEQLADARLAALRMQMQPHFLYNTLNTIAVVTREGSTETASRMLEQLGDMLRRVMRSDRPREVPLSEELDFLQSYLEIETIRFPDRLETVIDVEASLAGAAVPELVLQPLVENAIRHGAARRLGATRLTIRATREGEQLVLNVTDADAGSDHPGPAVEIDREAGPSPAPPEGVGLANTRARLVTLYGPSASLAVRVDPAGTTAVIRLPFHLAPTAPRNADR